MPAEHSFLERVFLLRHGETAGQSSIRYWGRTDVPLASRGREQALAARPLLAAAGVSCVVTSTLARSVDAGRLAVPGDVPRLALKAFDEIDFGRWEGWTREEIAARDPELFARWHADGPTFAYPGGESGARLGLRVREGFAALAPEQLGTRPLFAVHRGVIHHLLAALLGAGAATGYHVDLGALSVVERRQGRLELVCFNRTDFLG